MKVFFYIHSLTGGGAERVTAILANHMVKEGYEVGVITMTSKDRDFYPLNPNVRRITLNLAGVNSGFGKLTANFHRWLRLRRIFKSESPDLVIAMMTTSTVIAILAGIGLGVRIYGSERNYPGRKIIGRPWAFLRRVIYRFADCHIAQTRKTADWLRFHTGARNVQVIPNPVVWPIPSFEPIVKPEQVIPLNRKTILAVGSKSEQKGFDLLINAFAVIAADWPQWDLVILGLQPGSKEVHDGYESIKQLAVLKGIADRLHLPGRVGNVADWYVRADIFVLSSRYEGFPNVLLEAMASGCPSIAMDCDTGPRDIIRDKINGFLVQAESAEKLSEVMVRLIANESLRIDIGEKAIEVRETYSEKYITSLWQQLI